MTEPAAFDIPDEQTQALGSEIARFLVDVPLKVVDLDTHRAAKASLPILKRAEDRVVAFFADIKAAAWTAHRKICEKESAQLAPIQQLRTRLNHEVLQFERIEKERQRQEELRLAAERRREEQERLMREAEQLAAAGQPEIADQVLEQAVAAPAPVVPVPSRLQPVAGVSTRENWQYKYLGASAGLRWKDLTDEQRRRLLQLIPRDYLQPNESAIANAVKAAKSATKIPGIEVYDAGSVVTRG
jgi:hypothetical protein